MCLATYIPRSDCAQKVLSELRQAVKGADAVFIATDPDREGETIGWHLQQALHLKNPQRVVYSEITPAAVRQAIALRILDFGFWRAIAPGYPSEGSQEIARALMATAETDCH